MNFVIKGTICYNTSPTELATVDGYAVCEGGCSRGIFETLPEAYAGYTLYDCTGKLVIPGMVDLHIHASQFAYRGTGFDLELLDWLNLHAFPEESKFADPDSARRAYGIFADAMKKSATTRACVFASRHGDATGILMELLNDAGLVSYVGKVNMNRAAPEPLCEESAEASAADTIAWIERTKDRFPRSYPILTPRFIPSCTDALMARLGEIQRAYNLPIQSHVSENISEIAWVGELRPAAAYYGDAYDIHGLFGRSPDGKDVPTVMSHCVWSSDREITKMKAQGVYVCHCPASNLNVASGIAPIRRYLDAGLRVGLGSDVAGGQSESMFRAVTDTVQVSKMYWRHVNPSLKAVTFEEAFYMATRGGGEFFGKVGSFDEDYEFDALVLDDSSIASTITLDARQRLERAFYLSLDRDGIVHKFVGGEQIF